MSEISLHLDPAVPIVTAFAGLPDDFKAYLKVAFASLDKIASKDAFLNLATKASEQTTGDALRIIKSLASQLHLEEDDAARLLALASLCVSCFQSNPKLSADEFVEAAKQTGMLGEEQAVSARGFSATIIENQRYLKEVIGRSRLGTSVLPSLASVRTVIDVRPSLTGDEVSFAIPVVIAYITTDVTSQRIWLQLTKGQLEDLISDLQNTLRKLEKIEKWAEKLSTAAGTSPNV